VGFGRFLKKVGRLAKKGVSLAAKAGVIPGSAAVSGIIASRLQSYGANRRKLRLAGKGALVAAPKSYLQTVGSKAPPPPWMVKAKVPAAVSQIKLQGAAKQLVEGSTSARRQATAQASRARLASLKELDVKIAKLSLSQKQDLSDEFTRQGGGSASAFRSFLAERL
jgi:hypothetical protein